MHMPSPKHVATLTSSSRPLCPPPPATSQRGVDHALASSMCLYTSPALQVMCNEMRARRHGGWVSTLSSPGKRRRRRRKKMKRMQRTEQPMLGSESKSARWASGTDLSSQLQTLFYAICTRGIGLPISCQEVLQALLQSSVMIQCCSAQQTECSKLCKFSMALLLITHC